MIEIDNRNIFFDKLKTGINLFTGAGFSVLESPSGNRLPVASELCGDICTKFKLDASYSHDLEKLSSILKRNCKKEFQDYLREKYMVQDYNELYDVLNKINISSIITTNIDNLIYSVMDKSSRYYLNSVSHYGPTKKDGYSIEYIPLHGDVLDLDSELYFGKFELCNVSNQKPGLFSMMESALLRKPTVFWGYGFHDGSVSGVLDRVLEDGRQDVWIQLKPGSADIQYFRDLGCKVIIGDTEALLKEINEELGKTKDSSSTERKGESHFWKKYAVPSINQVESLPISDFYREGKTHWYYALTEKAYLTQCVNTIIDAALGNKNVIAVGIPLGGKTMMLMQVACKIGKPTYFVEDLNEAKAKLLCNNAIKDKQEFIILVDNCSEDMVAYKMLAECSYIRTVATSDDFMFESSKHILERVSYKKINIPDIEYNEAQRIFSNIPEDLRKDEFKYKQNDNDIYSILELISANVKGVISKKKIEQSLTRVKIQNEEAFELILLTAYLIYNKSALTTDVLVGYFNSTDINSIRHKIEIVQSYLSDLNVSIDEDIDDQDYYTLRSSMFAKYTHNVASLKFKEDYGRIIKKFIKKVSPCYIYKDYVFKRTAYDAGLFYDIFSDEGDAAYEEVYKNDPSAYTLQQWALYKAKTKRFSEAFSDIDKAIHLQPNNFSVKNARAIILFEANRDKITMEAKSALMEAMSILDKCYNSDKRKIYHAQKYAEFALVFLEKYEESIYIEQAFSWLEELIKKEESMSKKTIGLYEQLKVVR